MTQTKQTPEAGTPGKRKSGWLNVLIDYGPVIVFILVYRHYLPDEADSFGTIFAVIRGTAAFIVAAIIALAASKWLLGKVSPMLLLSTVLIVGFGSLTIFLADPFWVQVKPTVIYCFFGAALLGAWWKGKALLKWLLEAAFEGLSEEGWLKLSRNWGIFFFFLAALNETLRLTLNFGDWLTTKLWVFMPLTFLFTFSQIPMLLKHGLSAQGAEEEETSIPPP